MSLRLLRSIAAAVGAVLVSLSLAALLRPVAAVDPKPKGTEAAANAAAEADSPDAGPSESLSDDGRIGTVVDVQGIALHKPPVRERWSSLRHDAPLGDRDRIRTDMRGANAVKLRLARGFELTLGPGTEIEIQGTAQVNLISGEMQVAAGPVKKYKNGAVTPAGLSIVGPTSNAGAKSALSGDKKTLFRIDRNGKLATVDDPKALPKWLAAFEGIATKEPLGSLVVNLPDGRNEPLSIGYHKVDVEIRDQIARTTIEESFVNHTGVRLEGVFHFPLPADASVSGFGMWIGNELVEADVVEKQRAREIFETILREKRDPGLLEWTSGNLFKARVFPIEPHSEKRVKITYTQVLPVVDGKFSYRYALRSDLLRAKPVRELAVNVTIASARPIAEVACRTHPAQVSRTKNSARLDYSAREVSPDRDFEVVCAVGTPSELTVIPHRRGDDGYLLVQFALPSQVGAFVERTGTEDETLSLVVLCDTSGSVDREKRKQQAEFVASLLSSLGPRDRFQLGCVDVATVWAAPEAVAASADNVKAAREFLEKRRSLGWTNLDRAFDDALAKSPFGSQIIYIGDGIPTSGDRDPAAFVARLRRKFEKRRGAETSSSAKQPPETSLHAVTIGNVYEAVVMQGIAAAGGGSHRAIAGERTPQLVAEELLEELTSPGLRDVTVEFRGVRVAAQYPERLPVVVAGTQQTIVARYLPDGENQSGQIVVRGKRGSRGNAVPVEFTANLDFADAENGNSFIPRLWARSHLDHLLAQGTSPEIRRQVIALSEEFHIITPYTSLLVLESDEDRRRFGVVRRFEMRDGEDFFREGKAKAEFELAAAQSRKAREWRVDLRRNVLRQIAKLGRDPDVFSQILHSDSRLWSLSGGAFSGVGSQVKPLFGMMPIDYDGRISGFEPAFTEKPFVVSVIPAYDVPDEQNTPLPYTRPSAGDGPWDDDADGDGATSAAPESDELSLAITQTQQVMEPSAALAAGDADLSSILSRSPTLGRYGESALGTTVGLGGYFGGGFSEPTCGAGWSYEQAFVDRFPELEPKPPVPPNAAELRALEAKQPDPFVDWSPEATKLVEGLLRTEALRKLAGGLVVELRQDKYQLNWSAERSIEHSEHRALYAPKSWLKRTVSATGEVMINACDERERLVFDPGTMLGRRRAASPVELTPDVLAEFAPGAIRSLREMHRFQKVKVERRDGKVAVVRAASRDGHWQTTHTIDTEKNVLTRSRVEVGGRLESDVEYADFAQVAGGWWPGTIRSHGEDDRSVQVMKLTYRELAAADFTARRQQELAPIAETMFLPARLPTLDTARRRLVDGSAEFADRLVVLQEHCNRLAAGDALALFARIEKLDGATVKQGLSTLRLALLDQLGRREEAWRLLKVEAERLADAPQPEELARAVQYLSGREKIVPVLEQPAFAELLKPVFERNPARDWALALWRNVYHESLGSAFRATEQLALEKEMAAAEPWDVNLQNAYARQLANFGEVDAALAFLEAGVAEHTNRKDESWSWLAQTYGEIARKALRAKQLLAFTEKWTRVHPDDQKLHAQYLHALDFNGRTAEADATGRRWLAEGRNGELTPERRARLEGAITFYRGAMSSDDYSPADEAWHAALVDTARYFFRRPKQIELVSDALYGLAGDARKRIRGEFFLIFKNEAATLTLEQLRFLLNETSSEPMIFAEPLAGRREWKAADLPNDVRQPIVAALTARWVKAPHRDDDEFLGIPTTTSERNELETMLDRLHRFGAKGDAQLAFLRRRIELARPRQAPRRRQELFDALLAAPWTKANEDEAFKLIGELGDPEFPELSVAKRTEELHRFVDAILDRHPEAAARELNDKGGTDKLTRTELAARRKKPRIEAVTHLADRLEQAEAAGGGLNLPVDWIRIERMRLDVQLGRQPERAVKECLAIVGKEPSLPLPPPDEKYLSRQVRTEADLKSLLEGRALAVLSYLATRAGAKPELKDDLVRYLDAALELYARPELIRRDDGESLLNDLRLEKFRLLVALDRADDLERDLRTWIRTAREPAFWRRRLALLRAERGDLKEAIGLMETAERESFLTATDYRRLAAWYLATDARAKHEQARLDALAESPDGELHHALRVPYDAAERSATSTAKFPPKEEALAMIQAILTRSRAPEWSLSVIRGYYDMTQEPRALRWLPDTALGRTTAEIDSYLDKLLEPLSSVRNEAPVDEMKERLKELRAGPLTPADRRALDWFEAILEWKAAETLNQAVPHVAACLAALGRAIDPAASSDDGEAQAALLVRLGATKQPSLADARRKQLAALGQRAKVGSHERLQIVHHHAKVLFDFDSRRDEALLLLEAEWKSQLAAYAGRLPAGGAVPVSDVMQQLIRMQRLAAHAGAMPSGGLLLLSDYVERLIQAERHAAAEALIEGLLALTRSREERMHIAAEAWKVFTSALALGKETKLGRGEALLKALVARGLQEIDEALSDEERIAAVNRLLGALRAGRQAGVPGSREAIVSFAHERMPEILKRQLEDYGELAERPIELLKGNHAHEAWRYAIARVEQWPDRRPMRKERWRLLRHVPDGPLVGRQHAPPDAGDLEARALKLALVRFREYCLFGDDPQRDRYFTRNGFNSDQEIHRNYVSAYLEVAEQVYRERAGSSSVVVRIADVMWNRFDRRTRAVEILQAAARAGLLDDEARRRLARHLRELDRLPEAIVVLEELVGRTPDDMSLQCELLTAYHANGKSEKAAAALAEINRRFHQGGLWREANVANLAEACRTIGRREEALRLYGEAIVLRRRAIGDAKDAGIAVWHEQVAKIESERGNTAAAVEAALGAIVVRGDKQELRSQSLAVLDEVLAAAKDLAAFVKHTDAEAAKSGRDSPLVRKALGKAFLAQGESEPAIGQFRAALALQPNDRETSRLLVDTLDSLDRKAEATAELLAWIEEDRHDLKLYEELADRFAADEAEAERAATSIVEGGPAEAENHQALANLRERQNRWNEAAAEWVEVAELRNLEPTGLLGLAEAQLQLKRWEDARKTLDRLTTTKWPERFAEPLLQLEPLRRRLAERPAK